MRLRLPADPSPALRELVVEYFDALGALRPEHFRSFHRVLDVFRQADLDAVIYSDVLEYLDRENELAEGLELERQLLARLRRGRDPLNGILKTKLLPYQQRGAIIAACRGRVALADDMGLGKTVQALAAAEMLRRPPRHSKGAGAGSLRKVPVEKRKSRNSPFFRRRSSRDRCSDGANCTPRRNSSTSPATSWS